MYLKGHGVSQDYREAERWFRLAADQGNATAQLNLGLLYAKGRGVSQDYREAENWFRLAADQGDATAQANLGLLYANGYGLPQDYVQAYFWFSRAAAQGLKDALELRSAVASKMNPPQIAEAEELTNDSKARK
jgi:TPR repeat protein